jgi:hypothetical protein
MDRLDSRTARHVKRMTILKGHVLHGIFHLGLPSDSIDPRLDQCRRLCCDMGSTATFARAERGIAAEQVELVSHSRPAHLTYHRARTRPPERACGLEVPRSCLVVVTYYDLSCTRSSTASHTCLLHPACDSSIRPAHTHIRYQIQRSLSQRRHRSEAAAVSSSQHIRVPHVTNVHLSRLAQQTPPGARMVHR